MAGGLRRVYSTLACRALPCAMCHASSVLPLDDGTVLCAFFGGSREGARDTAIYLSVLKDGVGGEAVRLFCSNEAHWNPVLFNYPDGRVGLIFKVGQVIASWRSYVSSSDDGGRTWSEPVELVPGDKGGRGPVRNKPLRLRSGRVLCPASLEDGVWRAFVDISDDGMRTLRKSAEVIPGDLPSADPLNPDIAVSAQSFAGHGVIQPTLFEDESGVHMLLRSTFGCVMRSDSQDGGETWCPPYELAMPNNNSGLDAEMWRGTLYLACNPVAGNWGARSPLSLFASDNGRDFALLEVMENEPGQEFSYPCVRGCEQSLYVSYTYKRANIKIVRYGIDT